MTTEERNKWHDDHGCQHPYCISRRTKEAKMKVPILTRQISSYDLLDQVKKIILEDSKRICMAFKLSQRGDNTEQELPEGYPRCGTVGCVGGWCGYLLGEKKDISLGNVGRYMNLTEDQSNKLFFPTGWWHDRRDAQTPTYARKVADHVSHFQKKYEDQLKAHMCQILSEERE